MQTSMMVPPAARPYAQLVRMVGVTVVEVAAIYIWLRLHENGHPWWGLLVLVLGEALETAAFKRVIDSGGSKRWGPMKPEPSAAAYLKKVQRKTTWAGNAEVLIWVLWLALAHELGHWLAGAVLLVLMHIKHHVETVTIQDKPFRSGLFSLKGSLASAMEVGGAVACLVLIGDDQPFLAALAILVGISVEHAIQFDVLRREMKMRDIRLPRDPRSQPPKRVSEVVL